MDKRKIKEGAIEFASSEVKFKMDDKKFPTDIYIKPHVHTMEIIEEFALLSNRRISIYASLNKDGEKNDNPFIYRVHDKPKQEKITSVIEFLSKFGYTPDIDGDGNLSSKEINKILRDHKGKPEEDLISLSILRSMQKAIYSTNATGHFGLGFKYYSHFTSPIRRYPDMIAHRYLVKYLAKKKVPKEQKVEMEKLAIHSSEMEQKAVDAERQSIKFKYSQYYSRRIDEEFYGMIVNITKNGFFVENSKTKASGFVSVRDLGGI
jgi:ribonuclease R